MTASDALRLFLEPLLPGWRLQFGKWTDGKKSDRYAVIRPVGGLPAELVRRPEFTLILIGAEGDATTVPQSAADTVIEAMRLDSGEVVSLQPGEPVFMATDDGRPVFEIAISAITN
jgi:hypothetical protein